MTSARANTDALKAQARALGFDAIGVADVTAPWPAGARLEEFLAAQRHGEMSWIDAEEEMLPSALRRQQ